MPEAYRLVGQLKNNRLWSAILEQWPDVMTQRQAAEKFEMTACQFGEILNMKLWPWSERKGDWAPVARRIANKLGLSADYLFDANLYGVKPPRVEVEFTPGNIAHLQSRAGDGETKLLEARFNDEQKTAIGKALLSLTSRQARVIRERYGLDGDAPMRWADIATGAGISYARVQQIHVTALGKLQRRCRGLQPFIDAEWYS